MVLRLIGDVVRRNQAWIGLAMLQASLLGKAIWQIWPATDGLAVAMAFAGFLQLSAGSLFQSRELYLLPVSRRSWWLASWWLGSAGAVLIAMVAVTFGRWSAGHSLSVDDVAATAVVSFLYCGVAASIHVMLGRPGDAPATVGSFIAVAPLIFSVMAFPFQVARYLPHHLTEIDAVSAVVLAAAMVVAARGYGHQPLIAPRPMGVRRPRASAGAVPPPDGAIVNRPRFADRLTGWRLVLWDEGRRHLVIFSAVLALLATGWALASRVRDVPPLAEFLRLADALPFASRSAHITEPITWGVLVAIIMAIDSWMLTTVRPLRTLPISSSRLACLPMALSLVSTCALGVVMFVLHLLVLQRMPESARVDLFVAFWAVAASSYTLRFLAPARGAIRGMVGFAPVAVIWLALGYWTDSWNTDVVRRAMLLGGGLLLALSFVTMRHSLTRSSRLYRTRSSLLPAQAR